MQVAHPNLSCAESTNQSINQSCGLPGTRLTSFMAGKNSNKPGRVMQQPQALQRAVRIRCQSWPAAPLQSAPWLHLWGRAAACPGDRPGPGCIMAAITGPHTLGKGIRHAQCLSLAPTLWHSTGEACLWLLLSKTGCSSMLRLPPQAQWVSDIDINANNKAGQACCTSCVGQDVAKGMAQRAMDPAQRQQPVPMLRGSLCTTRQHLRQMTHTSK